MNNLEKTALIFRALSKPQRLSAAIFLADGPATTAEFEKHSGLPSCTAYRQLQALCQGGLAKTEGRVGPGITYRLIDYRILEMIDMARDIYE